MPAGSSRWRRCDMSEKAAAGSRQAEALHSKPQPATQALLNARDAGKTYFLGRRSLEVLRQINLTVVRGDFLAVRGASGAGKSTLLHLLGGLDAPTAGEIRFDGKNLASLSGLELARFRNRRVGFIFQAYHLLPELSALENVCLPARMARMDAYKTGARGAE